MEEMEILEVVIDEKNPMEETEIQEKGADE